MKIVSHKINNKEIAEIVSTEVILNSAEDGKDLLGNIYYQGFDKVILYEYTFIRKFKF